MQDPLPRLAVLARRLLSAIKRFEKAIQGQVEAVTEATEAARTKQGVPPTVRVIEGVEVRKNADDAKEDRKYQTRTFLIASLTLVVLIAVVAINAWQLYEMRKATEAAKISANAAKGSADIAKDTMVASNRPWLDVKPLIVSPLTFDNSGAHLTVQIETNNLGHSPAVRVSDSEEFIQVIIGLPDPWQDIKRLCQQADAQSALPSNRGVTQTIFPGISGRRERWSLTISPTEMNREINPGVRQPYLYPAIVWCVAYQADFSQVVRHTGYAWQVLRIDPKIPGGFGPIDPKNGPIPPENLAIVKYPFIGPLAD